MKTIYIDVYFLVNFTVDLLALYFSVKLLHIKAGMLRLSLISTICSILAVVDVLIVESFVGGSILFLLVVLVIFFSVPKPCAVARRVKFTVSFFIIMTLLGGIVNLMYTLIDKYIHTTGEGGAGNRGLLLFSLMILIVIGILRGLMMIFQNKTAEHTVRVSIIVQDKSVECEALIDSGNLAKDPMGLCPILFIKRGLAERFLPRNVIELSDIDSLGVGFRKRIRLIPISRMGQTHIMTGVRADSIIFEIDGRREEVQMTVVIDKEGGTYGGYEALAPLAVIENVS